MKNTFNIVFLLITTSLIINALVIEEESTTPLFDFDKLKNYTRLAECLEKINSQFSVCNKEAEKEGTNDLKSKCCGTWKLRDCWVRAADGKCDKEQVKEIHELPFVFMKDLEQLCKDYPQNSSKCQTN